MAQSLSISPTATTTLPPLTSGVAQRPGYLTPERESASTARNTTSTATPSEHADSTLDALARSEGALSGQELLALQADVFHEAIRVELLTRLADKISGGARQLLELR